MGDVLVVVDTPANLAVLAGILRGGGHKVRTATGEWRALEVVAARPPELILIDVLMPDLDGYATCHELKADATSITRRRLSHHLLEGCSRHSSCRRPRRTTLSRSSLHPRSARAHRHPPDGGHLCVVGRGTPRGERRDPPRLRREVLHLVDVRRIERSLCLRLTAPVPTLTRCTYTRTRAKCLPGTPGVALRRPVCAARLVYKDRTPRRL